jgi:MFS family permease
MQPSPKVTSMFSLIIAGEVIFLLPFILMRVFKPVIREAFLISDVQIGKVQALYGITAIGGFWKNLFPSIFTLKILYAFWEVSTVLLFWASLIKAIRKRRNKHSQGLSFGLLDGGIGFFSASIALFGAFILTYFFPEKGTEITFNNKIETLQFIKGAITFIVFLVAVLVWKVLPKNPVKFEAGKEFPFNFKKAFSLVKKKKVFFHSLIIFCANCSYKLTGVYGTNAKDVWKYSLEEATYIAAFIQYLRPVAAISVGWIANKFIPLAIIIPSFSLLILASATLGFGFFNTHSVFLSFTVFIFIAFGTYSLRGLYFAIIEETKIPI